MIGPFASHAHDLIAMGYSPIPLNSERNPMVRGWDRLRDTPMTGDAIRAIVDRHDFPVGLAVAGGFNGLVPIDFDTDDRALIAAVATVLPKPTVAKKGSKGFTAFYRTTEDIKGCKFLAPNNRPVVEVLTTGSTTIPPTMHPKMGRQYVWLGQRTLFSEPATNLPLITRGHLAALQRALEPWCPPKVYVAPVATVPREQVNDRRMEAFARSRLGNVSMSLSATGAGRNLALYNSAAALGKFVHHGYLAEADVREALVMACRANGYTKTDGEVACHNTITSGIRKAKGDLLPDLEAIPSPKYRRA